MTPKLLLKESPDGVAVVLIDEHDETHVKEFYHDDFIKWAKKAIIIAGIFHAKRTKSRTPKK